MCWEVALPDASSMQDCTLLSAMIRDQYDQFRINSDATKSAGAPEEEPDDTENDTLNFSNLYRMLNDNGLYQIDAPSDEGLVNLTQLYP
jgi:hypothetical protein